MRYELFEDKNRHKILNLVPLNRMVFFEVSIPHQNVSELNMEIFFAQAKDSTFFSIHQLSVGQQRFQNDSLHLHNILNFLPLQFVFKLFFGKVFP